MFLYDKSGHSFSPKACPTNFNTHSFQIRDALWHLRKPFKQLVLAVTFCVMGAAASSATDCTTTDPTTTPTSTPPASPYYGSLFGATSLHNVTIGRYKEWEAQRFRATKTGLITSIRPFFIWSTTAVGYNSGTGGTIRIEFQTNATGDVPSGQVLATATHSNIYSKPFFPLITLSQPVPVEAGKLYHLVYKNIDPNQTTNWISLDGLYMKTFPTPNQPTISDLDWSMLRKYPTSSWSRVAGHSPIVAINYSDGTSQGNGYMEVWINNKVAISGSSAVRQSMHVSGSDNTLAKATVRVERASGVGDLNLRVQDAAGTTLDSCNVPASALPTAGVYQWVTCSLTHAPKLVSGNTYYLVLKAPSDTVYRTYALRDGSSFGYPSQTVFADGYAQMGSGTTWTGWTYWGKTNRQDGDLQFYLTRQ